MNLGPSLWALSPEDSGLINIEKMDKVTVCLIIIFVIFYEIKIYLKCLFFFFFFLKEYVEVSKIKCMV